MEIANQFLNNAFQSLLGKRRRREAVNPVLFAERISFTPDPWQANVLESDKQKTILNCSRQSGKSTITAILAAHKVVFNPSSLVLIVCPSERQSSELLRKIREILLKTDLDFDRNSVLTIELENKSRVLALPSAESNLRGFSAPSLVVIDEASRCDDSLFYSLKPMLAVGNGQMILLSSPFGRRGFFYDVWTNGNEAEWQKIEITALDCPRITDDFLESEKASMPEFLYLQEYHCKFVDTDTQIFPSELIENSINPSLKAVAW